MKLTKLSAQNLKAQTFSHDLASVNIITGANASGKTAVLSAVRLVLLGYDSKLGKTPQAIFAACGTKGGGAIGMTVTGQFSDGSSIERAWAMRKGKVSYTGPEQEYIPPVMLDPTAYFAMTGPARLNYVLAQCDLAAMGMGYDALCKKLNADETLHLVVNDASFATQEVNAKIQELESARAAEDASVYDWLVSVVEAITAMRDKAKATAETHEETVKGLTDNKAAAANMTALVNPQAELAEAREQHTAAVQAEATAAAALAAADKAVQEAKELAAKQVDEKAVESTIAAKTACIENLKQTPEPGERPVPEVMTARPDDTAERNAYNVAFDKASQANADASLATREMKRIEAELEAAKTKTCCPTCGGDITEKQRAVIKSLQEQLILAAGKDVSATSVAAVATGNLNQADIAVRQKIAEIAKWDETREAMTARNDAERAKWQAKQDAYTNAQTAINRLTSEINALRASTAANDKAREAWAKLPALAAASYAAREKWLAAATAIQPIAHRIGLLEQSQKQFIARTQAQRSADQSRAQLATARARLDVFKAALKVVAAEKEAVSEKAFTVLLKHARRFTDGILKAPLEYRDSELGMNQGGNWVSLKAFSGTEELLALAGLGVALTQQHKGIKVVLMDELGRLDQDNRVKVINRMLALTADGTINQFFGVDVDAANYSTWNRNEAFKLIQVDSEAQPD